jgi:pimeloyl-ACP methyl ester carboxylesterase
MPASLIEELESAALRRETPCGAGALVWREWGAGPPLVLLHGGAGSWRHWARNIPHFAARRRVLAPDLPGLGDSADAPEPATPEALGAVLAQGLDEVAPDERLPLVGFSFGGIVGGHAGPPLGDRLAGLMLIGTGGLGLPGGESLRPRRVEPGMDGPAIDEVHRDNLALLMFADPRRIDDLAVRIQRANVARARLRERTMAQSDTLVRLLPRFAGRLAGVWGERDVFALPHVQARLDLLRRLRPDAEARIAPGLGHWIPYEAPAWCNGLIDGWLTREAGSPATGR